MKLEIIGFNIESCLDAQLGGAHRIELCDSPLEGGTTPSLGFVKAAREKLQIELYVMIRPRGGDFFYSDEEFDIMKTDIELFRREGCDGIVTGLLKKDGNIDKKRTAELVKLAYPLGVTFHRAFDRVREPVLALEDVIDTGCERILTSGLHPKAMEGAAVIKEIIHRANERIIIMPGSGVTSKNIISLAETTGASEFHSSASKYDPGRMEYINPSMNESLQYIRVNKEEVRSMASLLADFAS
jgi:copper homeostasis protein